VARATRACTSCGMCKERIRAMLGERGQPAPRAAVAEPVAAGLG
jgi:NAD(P)H-nitrite reductase large subunit